MILLFCIKITHIRHYIFILVDGYMHLYWVTLDGETKCQDP